MDTLNIEHGAARPGITGMGEAVLPQARCCLARQGSFDDFQSPHRSVRCGDAGSGKVWNCVAGNGEAGIVLN